MVTGSATQVVRIKDVGMDQIKDHLMSRYESAYTRMETITQSTTELEFDTRFSGRDAIVELKREIHRPHELITEVRPARSKTTSTSSGQSFADFYNGSILRGLMVIIILSFFVRLVINLTIIAWNTNPLLLILPVGLVVFAIHYLINFGAPRSKNIQPVIDLRPLLDQIVDILSELSHDYQDLEIKCWNCFETISTSDNVCAFCGKQQK